MTPEQLFLDHLGVIEQVVRFVSRRHRLGPDDAEELLSSVKLKVLENDYAVLRSFRGQSTLKTYLCAVIQRHYLDQRIARWGRWRPSACARRFGPAGILLDQLVTRDAYDATDAVAKVRAQFPEGPSTGELLALTAMVPVRAARRFVGEDALVEVPVEASTRAGVDPQTFQGDQQRVERALAAALAQLDAEDRTILRLRFQHDLPVSQIAKGMGLEQKPLYRRLDAMMKVLRHALESRGVTREEVSALVGHPAATVTVFVDRPPSENPPHGPSLY